MKPVGTIYLITNLLNNKKYVGQTTNSVKFRYRAHCTKKIQMPINVAIRKYGKTNFKIEEIVSCFDLNSLNEMEKYFIEYFNALSPNGYNLTTGGKNYKRSEENIKKMSEIRKGMIFETRRPWIEAINIKTGEKIIFKGSKAGKEYGFTPGLIRKCLCGQRYKHANHTFRYIKQANQSLIEVSNETSAAQRIELETV